MNIVTKVWGAINSAHYTHKLDVSVARYVCFRQKDDIETFLHTFMNAADRSFVFDVSLYKLWLKSLEHVVSNPTPLKMKLVSLQCNTIFYSMKWPYDIFLKDDWLEIGSSPFFVSDRL